MSSAFRRMWPKRGNGHRTSDKYTEVNETWNFRAENKLRLMKSTETEKRVFKEEKY